MTGITKSAYQMYCRLCNWSNYMIVKVSHKTTISFPKKNSVFFWKISLPIDQTRWQWRFHIKQLFHFQKKQFFFFWKISLLSDINQLIVVIKEPNKLKKGKYHENIIRLCEEKSQWGNKSLRWCVDKRSLRKYSIETGKYSNRIY